MTLRLIRTCCPAAVAGLVTLTAPAEGQNLERVSLPIPTLNTPFMRGMQLDYGLIVGSGSPLFAGSMSDDFNNERRLRLAVGLGSQFLADFRTPIAQLNPDLAISLHARVANRRGTRFYGFGNETQLLGTTPMLGLARSEYLVEASLGGTIANGAVQMSLGPVLRVIRSGPDADELDFSTGDFDPDDLDLASGDLDADETPWSNTPYGYGSFGQVGLRGALRMATLVQSETRAGAAFDLDLAAYPAALDVESAFATVGAEVSAFVAAPVAASPTLTVRLGANKAFGRVPVHEAAFLGGSSSLRGVSGRRFAGDATVFMGTEVGVTLGQTNFVVSDLNYGLFGLADVGRVWYQGDSPGGWHTSFGGGVWVRPGSWSQSLRVAFARSAERTRLFVQTSFKF